MIVTMLRNLGRGWPLVKEGQSADLEDKIAEQLVAMGLAVPVQVEEQKPAKPLVLAAKGKK